MILSLHDIVSKRAKTHPNTIAIIDQDRQASYKDLNKAIEGLAGYMVAMGIKKGERVGLLAKNSASSIAAYFAISKAGAVSVPLNHTLNSTDIVRQARDCGLSSLYVGTALESKARDIKNRVKSIRFAIEESKGAPSISVKKFPNIKGGDPASIIYTSGTTRKPLGVCLSHRNLISNNISIAKYARLSGSDRIVCVLPLYYIYGLSLVISHFIVGGTVIIEKMFAYPNVALNTIEKYKATGFAGVSSHYLILINMSDLARRKLPSLRYFMQAGDRMPPQAAKRLAKIFPNKKLYLMYGQTEASPRIAYLDPSLVFKKSGSIGRAIPGVKVKIVDKSGRECHPGMEGELIVKGDNVMSGYWNNVAQTKNVLKGGWLYTGDMGFKDKDGDIFLAGRKKGFIKIGGNRVSPAQIEDVISGMDGIMESAVVGVKNAILGHRLKLFVTLSPGANITPEKIIEFCKRELPSYSLPQEVSILKSMPRNSLGKIDRPLFNA